MIGIERYENNQTSKVETEDTFDFTNMFQKKVHKKFKNYKILK